MPDLTTCACGNLRAASRVMTRIFDRALGPSGLRASQLAPLAAIDNLGPITVTRLADSLVMDRTTLARDLKPLERDGLIRIRASSTDARAREITITAKGRKRLLRAAPLWRRAQKEVRQALGGDRVEVMLSSLHAVMELAKD